MILPLSLTFAAVCAILNIWLSSRVGRVRMSEKILHGDGGNPLVLKRMRAHANFTEYAPFVLILFVLVELAFGPQLWLWGIVMLYTLGRLAHAFGMEGDIPTKARMAGIAINHIVLLVLAGASLYAAYGMAKPAQTAAQTTGITLAPLPSQNR